MASWRCGYAVSVVTVEPVVAMEPRMEETRE
jgi:hypothetical protein